ncbi:hypothetical protein [Provencibacterium massiliense]|uniref:hypothetical protein n=1 Tax=Provencibacterium massiliense TaxID=1841868 RepID=UPI0009A8C87B|nr:hypothetical protein [Provencibacterium massiliense]RGB64780.1 hypothetical protein DW086_11735 [Harryflintia acetispora]
MASANKTALGLNQWSLSDKPTMEDFNADNALLDQILTHWSSPYGLRSLLINPYLIINQRGQSSYIVTSDKWTYFADRWRAKSANGTTTILKNASGGWDIPSGVTIQQVIEAEQADLYQGRSATRGCIINGAFTAETFIISGPVIFEKTFEWAGTIRYGDVVLGANLEEPLPFNSSDMLTVSRYFKCFGPISWPVVGGGPTREKDFVVVYFEPMRAAPVVTMIGTLNSNIYLNELSYGNMKKTSSISIESKEYMVEFTILGDDLLIPYQGRLSFVRDARVWFDAEIYD